MIKNILHKYSIVFVLILAFNSQNRAQNSNDKTSMDSISVKKEKFLKNIPSRMFDMNKINSVGSLSIVYGDILTKTPTSNLTNTLTGRLSGLTVNQGSGMPGNDNSSIAIRGVGSYGKGSSWNNARIFVDGFEVTSNFFSYMPSDDIESISVLKDAISLAQFGMDGANGIIWVVTKKGEGKLKINFDASSGIQSPIVLSKPLDSYNYANLYNQAISNDKGNIWSPAYSPSQLDDYKNGQGTNVDWYNQVLRKSGSFSRGDLSFSGGDKSIQYYVGLNYNNQQGILNNSNTESTSNYQFSNYGLISNLSFKLLKIFEVRTSLNFRIEDRKSPNLSGDIFSDLANYPSNIYPIYDGDTQNFSGNTIFPRNPYASIVATGWVSSRRNYVKANFGLREDLNFITSGLYLDESGSFNTYSSTNYSKTRNYARFIGGVQTTTDLNTNLTASTQSTGGQDDLKQGKILLGYNRAFSSHHIQAALDYNVLSDVSEGSYNYKVNRESVSGKANYNYNDRYIAEFGFSYHGVDAFRPGNQWGFYPSIGAAWILSNESFLKNSNLVNFIKVRGSAGTSGDYMSNATSGFNGISGQARFIYQQYYSSQGTFYTGASTPSGTSGLNPLFIANPDAFAEKSTKYNVGIDMTLFNKINITLDAYLDKRKGILTYDNTIPSIFGNNILFSNIGKMTSKGIDVDLNYTDKIGKLNYSVTGIIAVNSNTIDFMAEIPTAYSYSAATGRSYGTPLGLVADGFYQIEDFSADGTLKTNLPMPFFGKVQPGDLKYSDLNGDKIIDQNDVTAIGKPYLPTTTFSLQGNINYKGFYFSVLIDGSAGTSVNILSSANSQVQAFVNNGNAFPIALGAWAYYPDQGIDTRPTATYPRLTAVTNLNNYRTSSFWIKDRDYVRVRNAEIGYVLKSSFLPRLGLSKFRVFVNALNPLTFSRLLKESNIDPENQGGYPALKSFNIGFSATF